MPADPPSTRDWAETSAETLLVIGASRETLIDAVAAALREEREKIAPGTRGHIAYLRERAEAVEAGQDHEDRYSTGFDDAHAHYEPRLASARFVATRLRALLVEAREAWREEIESYWPARDREDYAPPGTHAARLRDLLARIDLELGEES